MTDQQRFDTLGTIVGSETVTPTWNLLASQGTYFERSYTSCPLCVPARTSLATGKNPLKTGMLLNDLDGKLAKNHKTLHHMLHEAGYEVAHIGVNHISINPSLATSIPFSAWEDDQSYENYAKNEGISIKPHETQRSEILELCDGVYESRMYSNAQVSLYSHNLSHFKDVWFTDKAIDFLSEQREKPFALFVCLWAPHPPLVVPKSYLNLFPIDAITLPETVGIPPKTAPKSREKGASNQLGSLADKTKWKEAWAAHYALCRLCDDQLSRIVSHLQNTGLFDDTLMVLTVDHGEQLGEHGNYQKMEMYESAVRVPVVIHDSKAPASSHNEAISHLDIVPTILDLLNISTSSNFEGASLASCVLEGTEPKSKPIFSVYNGNHAFGDIRRMIVYKNFKYVFDGEEGELFDLANDPKEITNLYANPLYHKKQQLLHQMLKTWAVSQGDWIQYEKEIQ